MIKNSFNEEYKTPKCKVFGIVEQKVICQSPGFQVNSWEEDDSDDLNC